MTEATIKRQIIRWLRSLPRSHWEVSPPGSVSGKPDITGCYKGRYVGIEVKRPKGRITPLQADTLLKLKVCGAVVGVARCLEDAKAIVGGYAR